jgi:hypothetical protein
MKADFSWVGDSIAGMNTATRRAISAFITACPIARRVDSFGKLLPKRGSATPPGDAGVRGRLRRFAPVWLKNSQVDRLAISRLAGDLSSRKRTIHSLTEIVGRQFGTIGTMLERMSGMGGRLVERSERLLGLATGKIEGGVVLDSTVAWLRPPLDYLGNCAGNLERLIGHVAGCERQIEEVLRLELPLQQTVAPLRFIQPLLKIESATLPPEQQEMFMAVTRDIEMLQARIGAAFTEKFNLLRVTLGTIRQVVAHLEPILCEHRRVIAEREHQLEATLSSLQREMEESQQRDFQLITSTRAINKEIGRMVVALQFHDIISQKAAHVLEGMTRIEGSARQLAETADKPRQQQLLGEIRTDGKVQATQLDAIRNDFAEVENQIHSAVRAVLDQTKQLDEQSLSLEGLDKTTVAPDGMVQVLLDTVCEVTALVEKVVQDASEISGMIQPIGRTAANLTETITEVACSMHLIALNAQIQAVHIGAGTGLEVLAARTAEVSIRVTEISGQASTGLKSLAARLPEIVTEFEAMRDEGIRQSEYLGSNGGNGEAALHAFRDHALTALSDISGCVHQIQEMADTILDSVRLEEGSRGYLDPVKKILVEIATLAEDSIDPSADTSGAANDGAGWKHRYTMESEREIHAAALNGGQIAGARSQLDHAMENTELFGFDDVIPGGEQKVPDPLAPPPETSALPGETAPNSAEMIDGASEKESGKTPPKTASAELVELGANVELF